MLFLPLPLLYHLFPHEKSINDKFWKYRILMNFITIISVSLIVSYVPSLNDRYILIFNYNFGIFIFIVIIFNSMFPILYLAVWGGTETLSSEDICYDLRYWLQFELERVLEEGDRSLSCMINEDAWNDIVECYEYGLFDAKDVCF